MLVMESAALKLELLPEVGGKIGQITDKRSGRGLLVPPQKRYRTIPPGDSWMDYDTSGMDDCFPNIASGNYPSPPWAGIPLPDHGEWVYGSWVVAAANTGEARLARDGLVLPYRAYKTVRLPEERAIELGYRVENRADSPLRYMWAAHPLMVADEQFELEFPAGGKSFVTFPADGNTYEWPQFDTIDLSREWIPRGRTLKIFVQNLGEGWCELRFAGRKFRFTFDPARLPAVGVWYNHFGFPAGSAQPFRCIAVEPCTSASDLLDALAPGAYPAIAAGEAAEWSVELRIG